MLVIPSVDVRGGLVVRLLRGDYARETVFGGDIVGTAEAFADAGARRVHLVDLDAARGRPDEASTGAMRAAVGALAHRGVDAQVGGGVRHRDAAQAWIDAGAAYVVIGSLAVREPRAAQALCAALPSRVLAGLDVSHGAARAQGWTVNAGDAMVHLQRWRSWELAGVVHTAIERDGTLSGPALDSLRAVCAAFPGDVLASGGVTTLDDVGACQRAGAAGAIVGRALHEGMFDLPAALQRFGGAVPS
ncbi:MAG TPA: 1-(5-phosphoribosyl)-5-[(5-phosphoribosylamino)methylideneamino] imidazole-4-carboxamide isomerase [Candidatus Deferrimicrobium sp.]|nr:1-(5-phosphoribosyl)-5-[(5-phosphoribosylamino)methylideneamino] imidazole-4-carboxamide isomerase [Candidatus Deferrimicrobium sp.]